MSYYLREEIADFFVVDFEVASPHEVLHVVGQRDLVEDVLGPHKKASEMYEGRVRVWQTHARH